MPHSKSIAPGVAALSGIVLLERFSYYGFRAIIVLFAISDEGLALPSEEVFDQYILWTALIGIAAFPMGIITDALLKQKNALITGSIFLFVGYGIFALAPGSLMLVSFLCMMIGSGFMRPNIPVLLGRLHPKKDRGRDLSFLVLYAALNIGAALAAFNVGLIAESAGFQTAFATIGAVSLLLLVISIAFQPLLVDNEDEMPTGFGVLRLEIILGLMLCSALFWGMYEFAFPVINEAIQNQETGTWRMMYQSFSAAFTIPAIIIFGFVWYFWKNPSSLLKISGGFLLATVAFMLVALSDFKMAQGTDFLLAYSLFSMLIGFSEILIGPIVQSVLTRLSPKYLSSSILGLFFALSWGANRLFAWISEYTPMENRLLWTGVISLFIGALLYGLWTWRRRHNFYRRSNI